MTGVQMAVGGIALMGLYVVCYVTLAYRRVPFGLLWVLPLALVASATYFLHSARMGTVYHSLVSDQAFQAALVNNALHGDFLSDAFDKSAVTHYPPLYFWLTGTIGRVARLDAIEITRVMSGLMVLLCPVLLYWCAAYVTSSRKTGICAAAAFAILGSYHANWFIDTPREWGTLTKAIHKPYEVLAAIGIVFWMLAVLRMGRRGQPLLPAVGLGLLGGALLLLYYPYFALGAVCLAALVVLLRVRSRPTALQLSPGFLAVVAVVAAAVAAVWVAPFLLRLLTSPHDPNYARSFLPGRWVDPSGLSLGLGYCGALFVLGLIGLWKHEGRDARLVLGALLVVSYGWWASVFITYPAFGESFLPGKPLHVIMVVLSIGTGMAVTDLMPRLDSRLKGRIGVAAFLLLLAPLAPTPLNWNKITDPALKASLGRLDPATRGVARSLPGQHTVGLLVGRGSQAAFELAAVDHRMSYYLAPSMAYSNPLSRYSRRLQLLEDLPNATDSEAMASALASSGIDAVLFEKGDRTLSLTLGVAYERGNVDEEFVFSEELFRPPFFSTAYEDKDAICFTVHPAVGEHN